VYASTNSSRLQSVSTCTSSRQTPLASRASEVCTSGLVISATASTALLAGRHNDNNNNGTVSTCSGRAGGRRSWCFVVGVLRYKQASRSHCNINQSCSALPQTETLLIRADRLRHFAMRRPHSFVTTHWVSVSRACRWHTSTSLTFPSWPCPRPGQFGGPLRSRRSIGQIVWLARGISTANSGIFPSISRLFLRLSTRTENCNQSHTTMMPD